MMQIGVDLDGVLANFDRGFNVVLRDQCNVDIDPDRERQSWDLSDGYVDKDMAAHAWHAFVEHSYDFWAGLDPLPGAVDALWRLVRLVSDDRAGVHFITSRPTNRHVREATYEWLSKHGVARPNVIIAHRKGAIAHGLMLTHFIDDKPENCIDVLRSCGTDTRVVLRSWKYNAWLDDRYIARTPSITEFVHELQL